jgi:hypothetical protein
METPIHIELVQRIVDRFFSGRVPPHEHDVRVIGAILERFAADQPPEVQRDFANRLAEGLDLVRRQQNSRWAN